VPNDPYFTITSTAAGWRARFYGGNGELMFWTETYTTKASAENAVAVLKANAASAPIRY
jgi:uncharacterized protein YegP (UPF0339 family)